MRSFFKTTLFYILGYFVISWWSKSALGLSQLYNQQFIDKIDENYYIYFIICSFLIVFLIGIRSIIGKFKKREHHVIKRYFRLNWFMFIATCCMGIILITAILSSLLFNGMLYINRTYTSSVASYKFQFKKDEVDDQILHQYAIKKGDYNYLYGNQSFHLTKKYGLLNLPYMLEITPLE